MLTWCKVFLKVMRCFTVFVRRGCWPSQTRRRSLHPILLTRRLKKLTWLSYKCKNIHSERETECRSKLPELEPQYSACRHKAAGCFGTCGFTKTAFSGPARLQIILILFRCSVERGSIWTVIHFIFSILENCWNGTSKNWQYFSRSSFTKLVLYMFDTPPTGLLVGAALTVSTFPFFIKSSPFSAAVSVLARSI